MPDRSDGTIEQARLTVQLPPNVDLTGPTSLLRLPGRRRACCRRPAQQATFTVNGPLACRAGLEARIQWPHGLIAGAAGRLASLMTTSGDRCVTLALGLVISADRRGRRRCSGCWRWYRKRARPGHGPDRRLPERAAVGPARRARRHADGRESRRARRDRHDPGPGAQRSPAHRGDRRAGRRCSAASNADFQLHPVEPRRGVPARAAGAGRPVQRAGARSCSPTLKNQFYSKLPPIYKAMYKELVGSALFPRSPDSMRGGQPAPWRSSCSSWPASACSCGPPGLATARRLAAVPFAFGVPGILGFVLARRHAAQDGAGGAKHAARWRAFGRYLADLQRFGNVGQAAQRFGDYLPYAVALGVDKQYTHEFEQVEKSGQAPSLCRPTTGPAGWSGGDSGARGLSGSAGGDGRGGGGGFSGGVNAVNAGVTGSIMSMNAGLNIDDQHREQRPGQLAEQQQRRGRRRRRAEAAAAAARSRPRAAWHATCTSATDFRRAA